MAQVFSGHFALVFCDLEQNRVYVFTDKVGVYRLYWSSTGQGGWIVGSSLHAVRDQLQIAPTLSPDALFCYMYFHMIPTPLTAYHEIQKLPPGEQLTSSSEGISFLRYWQPVFQEQTDQDIDSLSRELHQCLDKAVLESLTTPESDGAFLSGGLDSSTVVGVMSRVRSEPANAFSIGFNAKEYDETPFARISAEHYSSQHHCYYVTPDDVLKAVPTIAAAYQEPFGNSSAIPTYYCAKVASDNGIRNILAGDGGDELFAGNTRYAKQRHFRHYQAFPALLRSMLLTPLIGRLPNALPYAAKAKHYIEQAEIPLPDRLQVYNFLYRHNPLEMFNADYLQNIDTELPLNLLRAQYALPEQATELNRMLFMDWQFTLADNDLRKVSSMCALAGVDVKYPFLTDEVIDFSSRIPSNLKLRGGQLRYFYRHAMQGFLAPETLTKSKHGFGLPFGVWLKEHQGLRELALDSLSRLKKRGYFNSAFIDMAENMHRTTHAGYYGELIWVLMMLELWISNHMDDK